MPADIRTAAQNFMTALGELMDAFSAQVAEPKTLYSPAEVAEILCVSPDTVRAAIRAGGVWRYSVPGQIPPPDYGAGPAGLHCSPYRPGRKLAETEGSEKDFRPRRESRAYLKWTIWD